MKSITTYINEALKLGKPRYKYYPKTKKELRALIRQRIKDEGNEVDLNDIDVSNITDMSYLFEKIDFNGDIFRWDVSNVIDMNCMFGECTHFNGDISKWDVSNVKDMKYMFYWCGSFNKDISKWDVSSVKYMQCMFLGCVNFNQDISVWDVSNVTNMRYMFYGCNIEEKYKPKFKK